ncbi:MAG: hypothetical protein ABIK09_02000 [Pseudomonadota bacterium]
MSETPHPATRTKRGLAETVGRMLWPPGVALASWLGVNLALKLVTWILLMPFVYGAFLVLYSWKTWALVFLGVALGLSRRPLLAGRGRGTRMLRLPWGLLPACLPLVAFIAFSFAMDGGPQLRPFDLNPYGFRPSYPGGMVGTFPGNGPDMPDFEVRTNPMGYRDDPWTEEDLAGRRVAVIVGDSFVEGYGVRQEDILARRLERILNRDHSQPPWRVVSVAIAPSGIRYYCDALETFAARLHPEIVVMGYLIHGDRLPLDVVDIKTALPRPMVVALKLFGVTEDLHRTSKTYHQYGIGEHLADDRADLGERFSHLVEQLQTWGIPLVVMEYFEVDPIFDPHRETDGVVFVGWDDVAAASRGTDDPLEIEGGPQKWHLDPTLSFVGDGHPTDRANGHISRVIADRIRALCDPRKGGK